MDYQTFKPSKALASLVKCYWTLEVPAEGTTQRQRILPDGCLDMCFILGDDIKRYTSGDEFLIQPRTMVLGQITQPFFIEPTGYVKTFAVRFYPYGFANFVSIPIKELANKETPLSVLFDPKEAKALESKIKKAPSTEARIKAIEALLARWLHDQQSVDSIVKKTIDAMLLASGRGTIQESLKHDPTKRRQLERKFAAQVGLSPKQLNKVIRLQAALRMMLDKHPRGLAKIAYDNDYYDQAHFTKDFKEFTGKKPTEFFEAEDMALSSLIYKQ